MTATTLTVDIKDATVTVATGGTPGTKGISVVVDHSKITNSGDVSVALRRCAEAYASAFPPPKS